jgi:hypothetical protein
MRSSAPEPPTRQSSLPPSWCWTFAGAVLNSECGGTVHNGGVPASSGAYQAATCSSSAHVLRALYAPGGSTCGSGHRNQATPRGRWTAFRLRIDH